MKLVCQFLFGLDDENVHLNLIQGLGDFESYDLYERYVEDTLLLFKDTIV